MIGTICFQSYDTFHAASERLISIRIDTALRGSDARSLKTDRWTVNSSISEDSRLEVQGGGIIDGKERPFIPCADQSVLS